MKKFKKLISILCAVSIILAMAVPAFAAELPVDRQKMIETYAYMDTECVPAELVDTILNCRRAIVYGDQAWTVNGAVSIENEDGTIITLPEFSDLFPDWDLDEINGRTSGTVKYDGKASLDIIDIKKTVKLLYPSQIENTEPFYRFNANGNTIYSKALTLPDNMTKCNIGYSNEDTDEDLAWVPGLQLNQKARLETVSGVRYGVRASSGNAGIEGYAYMSVSEDPNVSIDK